LLLLASLTPALPHPPAGDFVTNFAEPEFIPPASLLPSHQDRHIAYDLVPGRERFLVHVPAGYSDQPGYGVVVYIHPGDSLDSPPVGWEPVLDRRRLLFVAALESGNGQRVERRLGLAVLAAEEMLHQYPIDPRRVYVAGWSGGARMASLLGFFQADLFHGTVQSCGSDFYLPVPHIHGDADDHAGGHTYGALLQDASADEIAAGRATRFTLITGAKDFRYGDMLDIFEGGFSKQGFLAKFFDVPFMDHENASATTLDAALAYVEQGP